MKNRERPKSAPPAFTPVPRKYRHDGWTPTRQHAFIEALADSGSVKHAASVVGMSTEGAYALRRQPGAEAFAAAWEAALDHGIRRLEDIAMDRAINGVEVPVYSYGKLVGTRIVYNDHLAMFMLRNRADRRFAAGALRRAPTGMPSARPCAPSGMPSRRRSRKTLLPASARIWMSCGTGCRPARPPSRNGGSPMPRPIRWCG